VQRLRWAVGDSHAIEAAAVGGGPGVPCDVHSGSGQQFHPTERSA
jgi:hypothetical protein